MALFATGSLHHPPVTIRGPTVHPTIFFKTAKPHSEALRFKRGSTPVAPSWELTQWTIVGASSVGEGLQNPIPPFGRPRSRSHNPPLSIAHPLSACLLVTSEGETPTRRIPHPPSPTPLKNQTKTTGLNLPVRDRYVDTRPQKPPDTRPQKPPDSGRTQMLTLPLLTPLPGAYSYHC